MYLNHLRERKLVFVTVMKRYESESGTNANRYRRRLIPEVSWRRRALLLITAIGSLGNKRARLVCLIIWKTLISTYNRNLFESRAVVLLVGFLVGEKDRTGAVEMNVVVEATPVHWRMETRIRNTAIENEKEDERR